jgi:hypothetical protein
MAPPRPEPTTCLPPPDAAWPTIWVLSLIAHVCLVVALHTTPPLPAPPERARLPRATMQLAWPSPSLAPGWRLGPATAGPEVDLAAALNRLAVVRVPGAPALNAERLARPMLGDGGGDLDDPQLGECLVELLPEQRYPACAAGVAQITQPWRVGPAR